MTAVKAAQQSTKAGRHEAATADFEKAIEIDASEPLAYVGLAETLLIQGNVEAAVGVARQAVKSRPNFGRAQLGLAQCLCRLAEASDSPDARNDYMEEALVSYDIAAALNAQTEPIPMLDEWRKAGITAKADALRASNLQARQQRWDDSRARHGLAAIPYGEPTEASKAILDEEATTENGKRWKSEYYHAKRKY